MKKFTSIALVLVLVLSVFAFASCKKTDTDTTTDAGTTVPVEAVAKYKVLPDGLAEEEYAIGFRKADQTLRDKVQTILAEMKADGTLGEISTNWFGSDVTTVKTTPTTVKSDAADKSLQKVLDAGKLVLGLDATFKPMGFKNEKNETVGFDIDVAKEVCKRLGVELVTKDIDWTTKEKTLNAGVIDCIWNGMSIDAERAKAMNLSEAYMNNKMVFVVDGASEIAKAADLKGKKVAVQSGSTAQTLLKESEYAKDIEIVELGTNVECLQQLKLGMIDAAFMDLVVADYEISQP